MIRSGTARQVRFQSAAISSAPPLELWDATRVEASVCAASSAGHWLRSEVFALRLVGCGEVFAQPLGPRLADMQRSTDSAYRMLGERELRIFSRIERRYDARYLW